jgi:DNA-binding XRE family transcriptional regulator
MAKLDVQPFDDSPGQSPREREPKPRQERPRKEKELATEFIRLRKEQNLTQEELARRAGTSQPAIARLESGNYHNLSLSFIRRVARALNASPEIHLRRIH